MQTVQQQLQNLVNAALSTLDTSNVPPDALQVVPCANPQFGDYQFNGALPLAKALRTNPRALAQQFVEKLASDDLARISEPLTLVVVRKNMPASKSWKGTVSEVHSGPKSTRTTSGASTQRKALVGMTIRAIMAMQRQ